MITKSFCFSLCIFCILMQKRSLGQSTYINPTATDSTSNTVSLYQYSPKKLTLPIVFFSVGALTHALPLLTDVNRSARYEVERNMNGKIRLDDYSQYAPAGAVYALNFLGVKGRHNMQDRTTVFSTTAALSGITITILKNTLHVKRPDGSNSVSFPSGHTATAFAAAQFLRHEYQDRNTLISLSGYPLAIFTGVCRVLNDKHWVGDVVAGAGIGILSTEASYWLLPSVRKMLSKKAFKGTMVYPSYHYGQVGWGISKTL